MYFATLLAYLTGFIARVGWYLQDVGDDIAEVYLIGEYLATPFRFAGSVIVAMAVNVADLSMTWEDIWPNIQSWIDARWGLETLSNYADYLIQLVQDFWFRVKTVVDYYYPELDTFFSDPYGYLYTRITDILAQFDITLDDLRWKIIDILADLLPDSWSFLYYPFRWVRDRIVEYNFQLAQFLEDPDGWLLERIQQVNPDLDDFIRDPVGFLWPRLLAWLKEKISDVAEDIINLATDLISERF